jgi:hypothetical protein
VPRDLAAAAKEEKRGDAHGATVRSWVRALDHSAAVRVAERALRAESATDVERLAEPFFASMAS